MGKTTSLFAGFDLFAGIPVNNYAAALAWYERLFGRPPTFFAGDKEAVWELTEHRCVFIEQRPEHAGHAMHTILVLAYPPSNAISEWRIFHAAKT